MISQENNLGILIKAARHRFIYSGEYDVYVRLSCEDEDKTELKVETCSPSTIRNTSLRKGNNGKRLGEKNYLVFDDKDEEKSVIEGVLSRMTEPDVYITLNESGIDSCILNIESIEI